MKSERELQSAIKNAAQRVVEVGCRLRLAEEMYNVLVREARQRGVSVPRTALSNPGAQKE